MSDLAIKAVNLSKQYKIGGIKEPYQTIRESLIRMAGSPFKKAAKLLKGEASSAAGLDKTFWALRDLNFEIKKGEVVGIIGRNGAGKSTLLKILSRITEPTKGYADIYGRVGSLLEVGTGFHPELTGRENIFLNGAILGMKKKEIQKRFDEMVAFAEIKKFIDTPVKHYSSGMYLRLAFAVAAHLDPEILMVDEVLAVGDFSFQSKCVDKMKNVSHSGKTVMFVSHNMGAIARLCNRCFLLDKGQIIAKGATEEIIRKYTSMGLINRAEYVNENDPQKPACITKVSLTSKDGSIKSEFKYSESVRINIEYNINEPMSDCTIWMGIRTIDNIIAFGSADTDMNPEYLGIREKGRYKTFVDIPEKWLNTGKYYVVIGIKKNAARLSYDRVEAVDFTILGVDTPESIRTGQHRPGILQPFFNWTIKKII